MYDNNYKEVIYSWESLQDVREVEGEKGELKNHVNSMLIIKI